MGVEHIESRALGRTAEFVAYVPEVATSKRLPVLYLLHGATGNHLDWSTHAHEELRQLSDTHQLIIINPDGGEYGWYLDSEIVEDNRYETYLIHELIPQVEARFYGASKRSIAGLSMGGHGAITLAWKHPGLFSSVSSMSGVVDLTRCRIKDSLTRLLGAYEGNAQTWHNHSSRHLLAENSQRFMGTPLRISCGESDYYFESNSDFSEQLLALGVDHHFEAAPGDHGWDYWTDQLSLHVNWHAGVLALNA